MSVFSLYVALARKWYGMIDGNESHKAKGKGKRQTPYHTQKKTRQIEAKNCAAFPRFATTAPSHRIFRDGFLVCPIRRCHPW